MSSLRSRVDFEGHWPLCCDGAADDNRFSVDSALRERVNKAVRKRSLARAIEAEIIPRLVLTHRQPARGRHPSAGAAVDIKDVTELVRILVAHEASIGLAFVTAKRKQGTSLGAVLLDLFVPSARYLDELWAEDVCSFADVTIALSRLHQILRELSAEYEQIPGPEGAPLVFLAAMPGDQHTFGISIVQEFFRRAGWEVRGGCFSTVEELLNAARSEPVDVVGLSISCDLALEDLASTIRNLRLSASNPAVKIVVGGRFFLDHPELVACAGADATAPDGRQAVGQLSSLLDTSAMRY
jgi:MerR family transcriptional regulator, light-induced transcriptional regulator